MRVPAQTREPFNWRLIIACWAIAATVLLVPFIAQQGGVPRFTDTDDVMRMVTVMDLVGGQAWQDTVEHRDNAPYGAPMHWSRLVDAPIAGLIMVLRPIIGTPAAEIIASRLWPPLMLLGLLVLSVAFCRQLLGPGHQLPAVALPVLSIVVLGEFSPGRVDHHNVQMILTTGLMLATIAGRSQAIAAIAAGLLAATSLAVGIETLPFILVAIIAFSLFWVRDGAAGANTRRFAIAFAAGSTLHLLLATPPSLYAAGACDALSATYVLGAALAGGALLVATLIGGSLDAARRLALIGLLGITAGAITLTLFPHCIAGPYANLDPRMYQLLVAGVPEAQPLWVRAATDPAAALSFAFAPFLGLIILVWCVARTRGDRQIDWLVLLLFLSFASIVTVLQVRGARLAIMPAIPAGAWLIVAARNRFLSRAGPGRGAALLASWLLFAGIAQSAMPSFASQLARGTPDVPKGPASTAMSAAPDCFAAPAYQHLAALPKGNVMAPMALGAYILIFTDDGVTAAGYHRNTGGALDVDDFLNAGEGVAHDIAGRRGLDYVVTCDGLPEMALGVGAKPDAFVALNAAGRHWTWLTPLSEPGDALKIYRIELTK
jgi:hypothetical protein